MARSKTPDEEIRLLEAERSKIAIDRDSALSATQHASEVLGLRDTRRGSPTVTIAQRERDALHEQARGRQHEDLSEISADAEAARVAIAENQPRLDALAAAQRECTDEIQAIEADNLEFFARRAHDASLAAEVALDAAREAIVRAHTALQTADGAWSQIRTGRRRLDWPDLPPLPLSDLGSLTSGFDTARRPPWPGGRRPADEQMDVAWKPVDYPSRFDGVRTRKEEPLLGSRLPS
jgi:hypothetical protein